MPVPVIIGVGAVAAATLAWWKQSHPDATGETPADDGPPPEETEQEPDMPAIQNDWSELLDELHGDVPVDYLQRWILRESNGNPCSVGSTTQLIRDGYAREAGIGQLYFELPSSTQFGTTSADLRVACSRTSQDAVRALTDDEMRLQVNSLVAMAAAYIAIANQRLGAAGLAWTDVDVLALAKLQHGLPALSRSFIPAAVQAGQGLHWASFRAYVLGLSTEEVTAIDRGVAPYMPLARFFTNAEYTAGIQ